MLVSAVRRLRHLFCLGRPLLLVLLGGCGVTRLLVTTAEVRFELLPGFAIVFRLIVLELSIHHGMVHVHQEKVTQDTELVAGTVEFKEPTEFVVSIAAKLFPIPWNSGTVSHDIGFVDIFVFNVIKCARGVSQKFGKVGGTAARRQQKEAANGQQQQQQQQQQ